MKKTDNIIIRVDEDLKNRFQKLTKENDLTVSAVLNACIADMLCRNKIPMNIKARANRIIGVGYNNELTIAKIKQALEETIKEAELKEKIKKAYLFGSYSRGEENEDSDIDIRIEYDNRFNLFDLSELSYLLKLKTGKSVDIATQPPSKMDQAFYNNIKKDEICIYERA